MLMQIVRVKNYDLDQNDGSGHGEKQVNLQHILEIKSREFNDIFDIKQGEGEGTLDFCLECIKVLEEVIQKSEEELGERSKVLFHVSFSLKPSFRDIIYLSDLSFRGFIFFSCPQMQICLNVFLKCSLLSFLNHFSISPDPKFQLYVDDSLISLS